MEQHDIDTAVATSDNTVCQCKKRTFWTQLVKNSLLNS